MTEAEWLACENPIRLMIWGRGRVSDRKLGLFAAACYRDVAAEAGETAATGWRRSGRG